MAPRKKRIVFDICTERFSAEFRDRRIPKFMRREFFPKMIVVCVFDIVKKTYEFYYPEDIKKLTRRLKSADEVISYNGVEFDIELLRVHYGLKGKVPLKGKHTDVFQIMECYSGFSVKLDLAARFNLGRGKYNYSNRKDLSVFERREFACKSDVELTYELWKLYKSKELKYPPQPTPKALNSDEKIKGSRQVKIKSTDHGDQVDARIWLHQLVKKLPNNKRGAHWSA